MKRYYLFLFIGTLLLCFSSEGAWAKNEVTFYAKLKTQVASSCSNMGKVYAGTSNSAGTYNASSSTSGELDSGEQASGTTEYTIGTFYAFAQENSGYKFKGWKESDDANAAIVSSANPYSLSIKSTSQTSGSGTQKVLYAFFEKTVSVNITFIGDAKGSYQYTISGSTTTVDGSNQNASNVAQVSLSSPSPKSGYAFAGFYQINTDGTTTDLSGNNPSVTFTESGSISIGARFVSTSLPKFLIKETSAQYYGLKAACAAAAIGQTIVPVADATLDGEDLLDADNGVYTIPSGVTLLIPYDAANTVEKDQPTSVDPANASNCKPYRTLTLANGITLNVSGAISVATKQYATNTTYTQTGVRTYYGFIYLNANSKIVLNSGATLYAWGYISGDGEVIANSGSTVYEMFQFQDFRGGTRTAGMAGNSKKVFPFQQYYIQNIESKLTLEYGATEYVRLIIYMSDTQFPNTIKLVGTDGAMFTMSGGSGRVTKQYERATDRMHYTFSGTASLSSISLTFTYIISKTVNSKDYVLPINNNMTIDILSGTTFNMTQDISVLPGAEINIEHGAKVVVPSGKALYVYDKAEWVGKGCVFDSKDLKQLAHVGKNHNNTGTTYGAPFTRSVTTSAKIKVDGTLEVSGTLYTTTTGADICSSGAGVLSLKAAAGTATKTYQDKGNSDYQEIGITAAKLHNADDSYTATAGAPANTTVNYKNGHWGWKVDWKESANANPTKTAYCYKNPDNVTSWINNNKPSDPTRTGYTFTGWSQTSNNTTYQERVYVAQWTPQVYTITYKDKDNADFSGTSWASTQPTTHTYGTATALVNPSKIGYNFGGWFIVKECTGDAVTSLGATAYTANITLYAKWTPQEYTITYKDKGDAAFSGTSWSSAQPTKHTYGTATTLVNPSKANYTFGGWYTTSACTGSEVTSLGATAYTANITLYAKWNEATHTVTVAAGANGSVSPTSVNGVGVATASDNITATPNTGYSFSGWTLPESGVTAASGYTTSDNPIHINATADGKTITANFAVVNYNVTYTAPSNGSYTIKVADEAAVSASTTAQYNQTVVLSATPADGYKFDHWTVTKANSSTVTVSNNQFTMPAEAVTISATFSQNNFDVTFDMQGHGTAPDAQSVAANGKVAEPSAPSVSGYTFDGWYKESTCTNAWNFGTDVVTANTTLYAKWTQNKYNFMISVASESAGYGSVSPASVTEIPHGALVTTDENTFTVNGTTVIATPSSATERYIYEFYDWENLPETATEDVSTIQAVFTRTERQYTITWKNFDDETIKIDYLEYGETPSFDEDPTYGPTISTIYTFNGWDNEIVAVTGDATYTATYTSSPRVYPVLWKDYDGNTLGSSQRTYGEPAPYASDFSGLLPTRPSENGKVYTFSGWSDPVSEVEECDVTYTALYRVDLLAEESSGPVEIDTDIEVETTTVRVSGHLSIAPTATLTTTDLILEASDNTSGSVEGNVTADHVYFDLTRTKRAGESFAERFGARIWYAVAVPWQVSVPAYSNGNVYRKSGDSWVRMTLGVDYDLIYYDGSLRYSQGHHSEACWRYVEDDDAVYHVMQPGTAYMIYLTNATDIIRFEKATGAPIHTNQTAVVYYGGSNTDDPNAGWNGIANPATYHAYLNSGNGGYGQQFIPGTAPRDGGSYIPVSTMINKMVVGQPIFVKVTETNNEVTAMQSLPNSAPFRMREDEPREESYAVDLTKDGSLADRVIVQTAEEKADYYEDGKDLPKLSISTTRAQMWIDRYGQNLCVNTAVIENGRASYPLGLFAPQAGEYVLSSTSELASDDNLFVTFNGNIIWDLSVAPYSISLENGTTKDYGLLLVRSNVPAVTTDVMKTQDGEQPSARKYLINNNVYILRGGEMFTITGAKVVNIE